MSLRKFFNTSIEDLEALAGSESVGRQTLEEIQEELEHRRSFRGNTLKSIVAGRIAAIDSGHSEPQGSAESARKVAALERIRSRLLDLSAGNKLLQFRHPKASSLRIVDEVPSQVFTKLLANQSLSFVSLPLAGRRRDDDDGTEAFPTHIRDAESLDARARAKAERKEAQARRDAARTVQARAYGINPDYELPATEASDEAAHRDSRLQTLLFAEELEAQLHKIHREAESSLQETGVNRLHLMFGFARWRESAEFKEEKDWRLAPLVLLPVRLRRGALDGETHTYRYVIERTGEDWSANVTFQEKCRREFGLEIPDVDLEADETLERYFGRIEALLRNGPPGWTLCRFVTLGLVSFGKILLWRDLDPATWPAGKSIFDSAPLRQLLGAEDDVEQVGGTHGDSGEHAIDDLPAGPGGVPPIIVDADSSQHSTLVDVERGVNLVIQGPPGTGKSQTITNLIAGALHHGKRVLFIAEKKTALDVVYSRLVDAGLGKFCVALHSHTSAKKQFLDDLVRRRDLRGKLHEPQELLATTTRTVEARKRLSQHATGFHTPFGAIGLTPFAILWRARRLSDSLGASLPASIRQLRLPHVTRATKEDVDRQRDAVADFAATFGSVLEDGELVEQHPWAGVMRDDASYADIEDVIDATRSWRAAMSALRVEVDALVALAGDVGSASPDALRGLRYAARRLVELADIASADLPHAILTAADVPEVKEAVAAVEKARAAWAAIGGSWRTPGALNPKDAAECERAVAAAASTFGASATLGQITASAGALREHASVLGDAERVLTEVAAKLGVHVSLTPAMVRALVLVVNGASKLDRATLQRRCEATSDKDDVTSLHRLAECADSLRAERRRLDERFATSLRPTWPTLKACVRQLAAAPKMLPALFSGDYRRARKTYREMAGGVTVSRETMIKDLRTIIEHHDKVALFDETPLLSQLFGAEARGIDSPFDNAVAAAAWYVELREITARLGNPGGDLLRQAWTASVAQWREAVDCVMASPDAWNAAGSIDEALRSAGDGACATRSVGAIREQLIERAGIADAILGVGQQAGAGGGVTIEWLKHQLASVRAACIADERLRAEAHVIAALGVPVLGTETNVEPIQAALEYIAQVLAEALPAPIATWLLGPDARDRLSRLQGAAHRLGVALDGYDRSETDVVHLGRLDGAQWCRIVQIDADQYSLASAPLSLLEARLDRALARAGALHPWSQCQRARATAVAGGLAVLVSLIEREGLDRAQAAEAYEAVFFRSLADALLRTDRTLDAFDGAAHDDVQKRFATLDRQVLQLTRHQIAAKLVRAPAVPGVAGRVAVSELSEEALIMHEAGKQRRHIAIRELFQRSGKAIQTMMPCFLMGPHAVAQYLPAGRFEFDLVVMDEASQMRVEDALGAIARGRQVVIVGDPMQLGPTKFFDSQDDDDGIDDCVDDNDNDDKEKEPAPAVSGPSLLERSESILAAAAVRFPTRMLRWHYRSRHPKLIAFSNREFYGGRLVVFPTPAITDEYHGVFLTCVSDAVYGDRQNRREAEAVVEAIRRHARTAPKDSLLVATLNKDQADLIDRLVEAAEKDDPELQAFRARHEGTRERLDVKNLESVQGDERDVILVSVTFGHDAAGKLRQNFGPILQSGGERRLNVLFTRAKRRLEVFCSFDPSTLRVGEGSSRGLKVLRDYLLYAQGEAYWAVGAETGRPPDSDFEVAVATALSRCGYEVRPQIGVAGYFIDLAIVDPDRPGRFILGVECDGATYHSAKSARDRDRLRQQQLEALGWRIHRIWSTDWFRDPEGQAKRVATRIEALRAARSADADADAAD